MEKSTKIVSKYWHTFEDLSHFFNRMPSGFALMEIILNKSGEPTDVRFLAINKAFEKMWGMKTDQIVGKTGKQIKANFKKPLLQTFAKVALTRKTARTEYFRPDLERSFALEVFSPEKGLFAAIINDITKQKEVEESLHGSEIRYRRLFEAAKDGVLILDAASGKVVDVNPYLIELLGISYSDILGKELWELGFFKDIASNKSKFLELQLKKYARYENLPLETATGTILNVEFVSNVYLVGHKKVIQCNIRDITDRRKKEEASKNEEIERKVEGIRHRNEDLERFNKAAVGRELRMIELKKQTNALSKKLGQSAPYPGHEESDSNPSESGKGN
jgi:PAS domain S-box-containing protein